MYHYKANSIYGYYEKKVDVYTDKNLKNMPYAQAGVRIEKFQGTNIYVLVSYETDILEIIGDRINILFSPSYSRSTIKHVIAFLREYVPTVSYQTVKQAYFDNKDYVLIKRD